MKRVISVITVVVLLLVSGCTKQTEIENQPPSELLPNMLLSLQDVKSLVSYETVVLDDTTEPKRKITYGTNPVGQGDPVILELYSVRDGESSDVIYEKFTAKREKRPKSEAVEDLGAEAYIAYPSINLYKDGYYVVITAGSGSGEEQKALLHKAAEVVIAHLNEYEAQNKQSK